MPTHEKINFWADRISFLSFFPLFFFLPISIALFEIFATIILSSFFIKRILLLVLHFRAKPTQRQSSALAYHWSRCLDILRPARNPLRGAIGWFLYFSLLSVIASQYPGLSWKGFFGKTVEGTVLFLSFVECVHSQDRLIKIMVSYCISHFLIAFDGIYQAIWKVDFIHGHRFTGDSRITASFDHPNDFGAFLIMASPVLLGLVMHFGQQIFKSRAQRSGSGPKDPWWFLLIFAVSLTLNLTALGLTYSRGAWVGFLAAMGLLIALNLKKAYTPLIIGIVFFAIFSSQIGKARNVTFVTDNVIGETERKVKRQLAANVHIDEAIHAELSLEDTKFTLSRFGATGRIGFWKEAWTVFQTAPLFGTGLNTYYRVISQYKNTWGGYPHNCYLQMLAEIGVFGLGAFLFMVYMMFRQAFKTLAAIPAKNGLLYWFIYGILGGIFGFLVHSGVDTNLYSVTLGNLFWLMMGVLVAALNLVKQPPTRL